MNFPFAVSGLLVGMFVNLFEGAFAGIGERFVDMISSLFASKFEGPRQKADKKQDLREKYTQLRTCYVEMDKSSIPRNQREAIEALFREALLHLLSTENEQAEEKLQNIEFKIVNAAQPATQILVNGTPAQELAVDDQDLADKSIPSREQAVDDQDQIGKKGKRKINKKSHHKKE